MMQKPIFLLLDELVNHFDLESITLNSTSRKYEASSRLMSHDHDLVDEVGGFGRS